MGVENLGEKNEQNGGGKWQTLQEMPAFDARTQNSTAQQAPKEIGDYVNPDEVDPNSIGKERELIDITRGILAHFADEVYRPQDETSAQFLEKVNEAAKPFIDTYYKEHGGRVATMSESPISANPTNLLELMVRDDFIRLDEPSARGRVFWSEEQEGNGRYVGYINIARRDGSVDNLWEGPAADSAEAAREAADLEFLEDEYGYNRERGTLRLPVRWMSPGDKKNIVEATDDPRTSLRGKN